jgi:predicted NBD/HSP70 family sugar kinase
MKRQTGTAKQRNKKAVLRLLRQEGPMSVSQIADQARLSIPTTHSIVKTFVEEGFLVPAGKGVSTEDGGKKPSLFEFNPRQAYAISVYIGADSITAATADARADILASEEIPLNKSGPIEDVVDIVADIVRRYQVSPVVSGIRLIGVAIGLPGLADPEAGISVYSPHYHQWKADYPFRRELLARVHLEVPVYIDNVNRFQALAERDKGAAKGLDNFVIIDALPEGLGAAFVFRGEIRHGSHNLSGEIGHMILDRGGAPCICGGTGCFEAMVSVRRVLETTRSGFEAYRDSLIFHGRSPQAVRLEHVFEAFREGDAFAKQIVDEVIEWFGQGLINVIMVADPVLIILQGIYNELGDYFLKGIRETIQAYSWAWMRKGVEIRYSQLGPERGVLGGAAYVCDRYFEALIWE